MSNEQQQQEPASKEVLDNNFPAAFTRPSQWQIATRPRGGAPRHALGRLSGSFALCALLFAGAGSAFAAGSVTVTQSSGGSAISADSTGGSYTALSGPTIIESASG